MRFDHNPMTGPDYVLVVKTGSSEYIPVSGLEDGWGDRSPVASASWRPGFFKRFSRVAWQMLDPTDAGQEQREAATPIEQLSSILL